MHIQELKNIFTRKITIDNIVQTYRIIMWGCPMEGTPRLCNRIPDCKYRGEQYRYHYHYCHLYDLDYTKV